MRCDEIQSKLSPYIDGELPLISQNDVRIHLSSCKDCRLRLKELLLVEQKLQTAELPANLSDPKQINRMIHRYRKNFQSSSGTHQLSLTVSGGVSALMLVAGLLVGSFLGFGFGPTLQTNIDRVLFRSPQTSIDQTAIVHESLNPEGTVLTDASFELRTSNEGSDN